MRGSKAFHVKRLSCVLRIAWHLLLGTPHLLPGLAALRGRQPEEALNCSLRIPSLDSGRFVG